MTALVLPARGDLVRITGFLAVSTASSRHRPTLAKERLARRAAHRDLHCNRNNFGSNIQPRSVDKIIPFLSLVFAVPPAGAALQCQQPLRPRCPPCVKPPSSRPVRWLTASGHPDRSTATHRHQGLPAQMPFRPFLIVVHDTTSGGECMPASARLLQSFHRNAAGSTLQTAPSTSLRSAGPFLRLMPKPLISGLRIL